MEEIICNCNLCTPYETDINKFFFFIDFDRKIDGRQFIKFSNSFFKFFPNVCLKQKKYLIKQYYIFLNENFDEIYKCVQDISDFSQAKKFMETSIRKANRLIKEEDVDGLEEYLYSWRRLEQNKLVYTKL